MKRLFAVCLLWPVVALPADLNAAKPAAKADPLATKLLADARAARATWENFPGFRADLEVNNDGKIAKGKVEVSADGKVTLDLAGADEKVVTWAKRQLASLVGHRLDSSEERQTPCAFLDDNATHPLGRAIGVLNDELHSSYRIRGREISEVNRSMSTGQFTITVLENRLNAEKKYLPVAYVVDSWDIKGELTNSSAHHQTWVRVGGFDLPETLTITTSFSRSAGLDQPRKGAPPRAFVQIRQSRALRFSNQQLLR